MEITHDTTIEEYEAWLSTNPDFTAFKVAVRATFRIAYRTIARIKRLVKRVKTRSSFTPKIALTVYPLAYDKNSGYTRAKFYNWLNEVSIALTETREHIRLIELFDCLGGISWAAHVYNQRNERIMRVEKLSNKN